MPGSSTFLYRAVTPAAQMAGASAGGRQRSEVQPAGLPAGVLAQRPGDRDRRGGTGRARRDRRVAAAEPGGDGRPAATGAERLVI